MRDSAAQQGGTDTCYALSKRELPPNSLAPQADHDPV
jgi:hypothetical protein